MFTRVLTRIRDKIRNRQYVVTEHALKEMNDDYLAIFDIERAILTGEILERQRDEDTLEPKYRIRGRSVGDAWIETIVKMTPTGKAAILTVYKI
jgi:hypothetical protein